jgi:hypothetical protein
VAKKTQERVDIKKSLCLRSSRNHGALRNHALRYTLAQSRASREKLAGYGEAKRAIIIINSNEIKTVFG